MKKIILLLIVATLMANCHRKKNSQDKPDDIVKTENTPLKYPVSEKVSVVDNYFGTDVPDPYRWLEAPDTLAVRSWIEAQNDVTFSYLKSIPFRESIRQRLEKIWNYPKYSAPFKRGEHYYFYKNDGLQNQAILYIMDELNGEPRVFIDPNKFSADGTGSLAQFSVSKDGKFAAYAKSEGGSDWNEFFVRNVETGEDTQDHLKWIKFSGAAWNGDGFFYGRYPQAKSGEELAAKNENKQIFFHKLGTTQEEDKLIFEDPKHPRRGIYPTTTDDERFLLLYLNEGATSDNALYIKDLTNPKSTLLKLIDNFDFSYNVIDNIGDDIFVLTNDGAPRGRLVSINLKKPKKSDWKELIPQKEQVLNSVSLVGGKMFASYLDKAASLITIHDLEGMQTGTVKLPGLGTASGINGKKEDTLAFYSFTSHTYPSTIFKYNVVTNESEIFRNPEVDFNPADYETKRVIYKSKDGTDVSMFITHKKGIKLDGQNPTLLYGYGGFNINILPSFSISNIILLENGGIYAEAHLRGGGEYGEDWHKDGMLLKKQNVFDDFIGAAEYLQKEGYTSPEKLAIMGRSNGGLLVGAVMCQRPDLFSVAYPGVGVMDMLRFHKFTIGHAWVVEYGNSERDKAEFDNLFAYSPLHNLKDGTSYPATMVTTADHDDRVVPAHSFKFAARLQEAHKGEAPVLIRIDTKAGHGAGKPTSMVIEEWADIWSFMFRNMNVKPIY